MNNFTKGFTILEVIIGASIMLLITTGILSSYVLYLQASGSNMESIQSAFILEEGVEGMRSIRDAGWTANIVPLTTGETYYLSWNSGLSIWQTTTTATSTDGFVRKIILYPAYRDSNSNLVSSSTPGAIVDVGTRQMNISTTWSYNGSLNTKTIVTYISNIFNN
ncbi:MAG: hypothetical protein WCI52_03280 [bacterium]